jgi:hypothetical protein
MQKLRSVVGQSFEDHIQDILNYSGFPGNKFRPNSVTQIKNSPEKEMNHSQGLYQQKTSF